MLRTDDRHRLVGRQGCPGAVGPHRALGPVVAGGQPEFLHLRNAAHGVEHHAVAIGEIDDMRHQAQGTGGPVQVGPGHGQQFSVGLQPLPQVLLGNTTQSDLCRFGGRFPLAGMQP